MSTLKKQLAVLSLSALVLAFTGCFGGPSYDTGLVTGTVTMDGAPLAGAKVRFIPAGGSPSTGRTDSSGNYELRYNRNAMGAEPGTHSVKITTYSEGNSEAEPPVPASPETVPSKYNDDTELKVDVVNGKNTHDFDLKAAGGKIAQPEGE